MLRNYLSFVSIEVWSNTDASACLFIVKSRDGTVIKMTNRHRSPSGNTAHLTCIVYTIFYFLSLPLVHIRSPNEKVSDMKTSF